MAAGGGRGAALVVMMPATGKELFLKFEFQSSSKHNSGGSAYQGIQFPWLPW